MHVSSHVAARERRLTAAVAADCRGFDVDERRLAVFDDGRRRIRHRASTGARNGRYGQRRRLALHGLAGSQRRLVVGTRRTVTSTDAAAERRLDEFHVEDRRRLLRASPHLLSATM